MQLGYKTQLSNRPAWIKLSLSQAFKKEKTLTTVFRGVLNDVLMQIQI